MLVFIPMWGEVCVSLCPVPRASTFAAEAVLGVISAVPAAHKSASVSKSPGFLCPAQKGLVCLFARDGGWLMGGK